MHLLDVWECVANNARDVGTNSTSGKSPDYNNVDILITARMGAADRSKVIEIIGIV